VRSYQKMSRRDAGRDAEDVALGRDRLLGVEMVDS
jgi:hypothetical protein